MKRLKLAALSVLVTLTLFLGAGLAVNLESVQGQGGVTGFANLRISNFYRAQPRTAITVTQDATVNPTGTYQRLTAASAVSTSGASLTVKPAGTLLVLINSNTAVTNTITFTETGTLKSAGNIVLGALDSATLISDGTNWYQIGASNN